MTARDDAPTDAAGLDPHWEWIELHTIDKPGPIWIRAACRHLETEPVRLALTGETVARLCLTCDGQLPPLYEERLP